MNNAATVLVIDDQQSSRELLHEFLEDLGHHVLMADSVEAAQRILQSEPCDLVVTDMRMPGISGLDAIRIFRELDPVLPVILVTAFATVETAVRAIKLGAFDYVRKPIELDEMEITVSRALEHRRLLAENRQLRSEVQGRYRLEDTIGKSAAMQRVFELVRKVAPADVPVLVTGESGTGKELIARALHGLSTRAKATFLSLNCAAVPENLLESELFGHARGAFTGAERARAGYFREANGGTLFLDEIGDMSLAQQAKLLRVLESKEVTPVGAERPLPTDVRLLTATNRDLEREVKDGHFRADLLFRIDTVRIELPPLRERREDVPLLVAHFLEKSTSPMGSAAPRMSAEAMRALLSYEWPGNVRELEHAVEHAALVCSEAEITAADLPPRVRGALDPETSTQRAWISGSYREARQRFERAYFHDVLERAEGNVQQAASLAGLHRATLHTKIKQLGLTHDDE